MMDAQKINFMLSIQVNIDKLESELGANDIEVKKAKILFEKLWRYEMSKPSDNANLSQVDLTPIKKDTEIIIEQVRRVTNKFDLIDAEIELRAINFYKDFPIMNITVKEFKMKLVQNFELFELSLKKEDHKQAAKYAIMQLEGILNFIEPDLIKWIEDDTERKTRLGAKIKVNKNGSKNLNFYDKCWITKEFIPIKYFSSDKINLVYDVRNYESHQFVPEKIIEYEAKLLQLKNSLHEYYEEVYKLIKECFKAIK